jgi:hypothetical protein
LQTWRPLLNSEPRNRAGVSVYQGYGGMQEIGYLLLLARLRLEHRVHIWSLLSPALREACPGISQDVSSS